MTRRFYVRTFGCQMNEHDSERIAGLLVADGLEPTQRPRGRRRRRPQHLLHPGERRQQALRPPRAPQEPQGPSPGPPDRGRRLPGPEGPRRDRQPAPATSTSCSAPTTWPMPRRCSPKRPGPGVPVVEILEEHEAYPSALPARREVDHSGLGHDPDRLRQLVHVLHRAVVRGAEVSRRMGDIVHEVERPRRRRRQRDHAARSERQLLRPRPRRRSVPPAVRRPAARGRRGGRHPSGSATRRRTRRTCGPRPSPRWPSATPSVSTCTCRCSPGATRRSPGCTAAYTAERYLEKLAARPGRDPGPRGDHRHHRRLPGRDRRGLRRHPGARGSGRLRRGVHLRLLAAARYAGRRHDRRVRARGGRRERMGRLTEVVERIRWPTRRPGSVASRRCWSKDRRRRTRP